MALRKLGKLIKLSTKVGLTGGTVYLYYEAGLWKGTDETIENYEKLKKELQKNVDANQDVKKWAEFISSSVSSNVKPYSEAVANFRKEWLDYDLSVISRPINGMVKPAWNKSVTWTVETVADLPENIPKWGVAGWEKIQDLATQQTSPALGSKTEAKH